MVAALIERLWVGNAGRNFNYLIACPASGEALVIDPLDADLCLGAARQRGWRITQVLNTHEHNDHIGGNAAVRAATGALLLAHPLAERRVGPIDQPLREGDVVAVGSVRLHIWEAPGHTPAHVVAYLEAEPAVFSGDTLFGAGVGNCTKGGDPNQLYDTFRRLVGQLPPATRLYPGHDYMDRNLAFARDREPDNDAARHQQERIKNEEIAPVSTLAEERTYNPFLRLDSATLRAHLQRAVAELPKNADDRATFLALRKLRDRW